MDNILIASYLILVLLIGLLSGLGVKSVKDYAVAKKQYGTFMLTMTFLASSFGSGAIVGDVAKIASDGMIFTVAISGFLVCCLVMSQLVAPYFDSRFSGMLSAGDIMKHFYGKKIERVVALLGVIVSSLYIGGQLTALGRILGVCLGLEYEIIVISAALVVVIYASFGGIRSVAMADVLKFSIIITVVPLMTFIMIRDAGGISNVLQSIPSSKFSIYDNPKFKEYALLFLISITPFLWMYPPIIQRFLMAHRSSQLSIMYRVQLIVRLLFMIMVLSIAFSGMAMFPDIPAKNLVGHIIHHVLPTGLKGMFIICILAASMSTSDSHINAASVLLAHNYFKYKSAKTEMIILRLSTLFIGCFAILVSIYNLDIVNLIMSAFSIWGAGVTIPLLAAVMKFKHSNLGFWCCLISSILSFIAISFFVNEPGLLAPGITVIAGLASFIVGNKAHSYLNKSI